MFMPKRRVNLCLSEEAWQRLKKLAEQRRISASAAVEQAIESAVESEEAKQEDHLAAIEELLSANLGPIGTPEELCEELNRAHLPCGFEDEA